MKHNKFIDLFSGLLGNIVSLRVFTSKAMRQLSSSYYLSTLSASDILVLLTHVLFDWLEKGLHIWPGNHRVEFLATEGVCQFRLYLSYSFRLISVGLIVLFTVERYIGVCMPLRRKEMCTQTFAKRIIGVLILISLILCLYKPFISGVHNKGGDKYRTCTAKESFRSINYTLDVIYGILITAVPFLMIASLNLLILRRLLLTNRRHRRCQFINCENVIRLEFTFILLIISTCFIALNIPYFVVWCLRNFSQPTIEAGYLGVFYRRRGIFYITKTIFYINYCINFFLYSLTGAYFRQELRMMFNFLRRKHHMKKYRSNVMYSNTSATPPKSSWM